MCEGIYRFLKPEPTVLSPALGRAEICTPCEEGHARGGEVQWQRRRVGCGNALLCVADVDKILNDAGTAATASAPVTLTPTALPTATTGKTMKSLHHNPSQFPVLCPSHLLFGSFRVTRGSRALSPLFATIARAKPCRSSLFSDGSLVEIFCPGLALVALHYSPSISPPLPLSLPTQSKQNPAAHPLWARHTCTKRRLTR